MKDKLSAYTVEVPYFCKDVDVRAQTPTRESKGPDSDVGGSVRLGQNIVTRFLRGRCMYHELEHCHMVSWGFHHVPPPCVEESRRAKGHAIHFHVRIG